MLLLARFLFCICIFRAMMCSLYFAILHVEVFVFSIFCSNYCDRTSHICSLIFCSKSIVNGLKIIYEYANSQLSCTMLGRIQSSLYMQLNEFLLHLNTRETLLLLGKKVCGFFSNQVSGYYQHVLSSTKKNRFMDSCRNYFYYVCR